VAIAKFAICEIRNDRGRESGLHPSPSSSGGESSRTKNLLRPQECLTFWTKDLDRRDDIWNRGLLFHNLLYEQTF
jgi:hypothetical protein